MRQYRVFFCLILGITFGSCGSAEVEIEESSQMDKLCECFEQNNKLAEKVNSQLDTIKRQTIIDENAGQVESCKKIALTIAKAMEEMEEDQRKKNQEEFQNSCPAYKEYIDDNY